MASVVGTAALLDTQIVIPDLVRKVAQLLSPANGRDDRMNGLDDLYKFAFISSNTPSSIDQGEWKDEWWNELEKAAFPHKDVSIFLISIEMTLIYKGSISPTRIGIRGYWNEFGGPRI
jgi:hypothetical protein